MKDIELPITQTFSITIDTHNIDKSEAVQMENGRLIVPLGTVVDEQISALMESARKNGGKILYATTSIEQQMEALLMRFFMGPFEGHDERRVLFENEILQSTALSYSAKKELVSKVVSQFELLPGKKKNRLQKHMKSIMDWRNAFAHGKIQHDNIQGYFINYYSGEKKILKLTEPYWEEVESSFKECNQLLSEALKNINQA